MRTSRAVTVHRGDIRIIVPPNNVGEARLGLVLRVDSALPFTEVALIHPYTELATSKDGVVPLTLTNTPYDIVVQTDLRGVVWTEMQVSNLIGYLSNETLEEMSDLVGSGESESPTGIQIGTPLNGYQDRRWSFKASEGEALDLLTSDCTNKVLDETA